jgi:hypothetical protein
MFPSISYLVVAVLPCRGCVFERLAVGGVVIGHETWRGSNILQVSQKHQAEHVDKHHISPPYCNCFYSKKIN